MKASGYFLLLLFLIATSLSWGQTNDLPEPQMNSDPGGPPPPGLVVPIDTDVYILLIAGLFLGSYFLLLTRRKSPSQNQ